MIADEPIYSITSKITTIKDIFHGYCLKRQSLSTPFRLILHSQSPLKRAKARHSAQGIV